MSVAPPDREDRAREIFLSAIDSPPDERSALLEDVCAGDSALRADVESLLAHEERAQERFARAAVVGDAPSGSVAPVDIRAPEPEGRRIGRYTTRRSIASGGMGIVYEAVQEHPHRTVALKLLHQGATSREAMRRFEHEVEILGRLRHPGIAQIYEAGTIDEGEGAQPYFAMELIDGRTLTAYAEALELSVRARLALFTKVCEAVQYAHRRGVIHRDLKPDNILVDAEGKPKILDFGVARSTGSDITLTTMETSAGQIIGTVQYMSPEQAAGDPHELDVRSDVYALGVVLYELLAARLPYVLKDRTIPEAVRIIREDDPTPLGSVNRTFRGDVATIVAKALEKDRERRYQSAAELATDVRHYLENEPIVARPASTFYQLRKFARRNRGLVGGVTAAFAVLLVALVVVSLQAVRIQRAATRSAETSAFLESLLLKANFLGNENRAIEPDQIGLNVPLLDVLLEGLEPLEEHPFADRALEAMIRHRAGQALFAASRVEDSVDQLERALEIQRELLGDQEADRLECMTTLAMSMFWANQTLRARELAEEACDGYEALADDDAPDERMVQALFVLGCANLFVDPEESVSVGKRMVEILRTSDEPLDFAAFLPKTLIGNALCMQDRADEAEPWLKEAEAEMLAATGGRHPLKSFLDQSFALLAARQDRWDEAEEYFDISERGDIEYRGENTLLGCDTVRRKAQAEQWRGRWAEAVRLWRRALEADVASTGLYSRNAALRAQAIGHNLIAAGEFEEAEQAHRFWLELADRVTLPESNLGWGHYWFATALRNNGKPGEAEEHYRLAHAIGQAWSPDHLLTLLTGHGLARCLCDQGRYEEAEPFACDVVNGFRRTRSAPDLTLLAAIDTLARVRRGLGQSEEAQALADEVESVLLDPEARLGSLHFELTAHCAECLMQLDGHGGAALVPPGLAAPRHDVVTCLVRLYEARGRHERAEAWRALVP